MTTFSQPQSGARNWVAVWWFAARDAWRARRTYRRTLRELRKLSQREADDLGISREMMTRLAAEAAYGKRK